MGGCISGMGGRCSSPPASCRVLLGRRSPLFWSFVLVLFSSSIDLSLRVILDEVTCRFGLYNGSNGHGGGFSSGVLLVFFWVLLVFFCVIEHQKNTRRTPEEHQKERQKNPEEPRRRRTPAPLLPPPPQHQSGPPEKCR